MPENTETDQEEEKEQEDIQPNQNIDSTVGQVEVKFTQALSRLY